VFSFTGVEVLWYDMACIDKVSCNAKRRKQHLLLIAVSVVLFHLVIFSPKLPLATPLCIAISGANPFSTPRPLHASSAKLPKIYVHPSWIQALRIPANRYPGVAFAGNITSSPLASVSNWLWIHSEYKTHEYLVHRALHDTALFTDKLEEAALCYPDCHASDYSPRENVLKISVKRGFEYVFSGCRKITIGIETWTSACSFPVPYWHSMYFYSGIRPWELSTPRHTMLAFIGGSWRGTRRGMVISRMQSVSDQSSTASKRLFHTPLVFHSKSDEADVWATESFFLKVWELYATSVFSWQPAGDSESRRGFYDSWILGCIPVVSRSSACVYKQLFGGRLFIPPAPVFEDIVVVLDDEIMLDGAKILHELGNINDDEIRNRRDRMARIAPAMQWGWVGSPTDALRVALMSIIY
jgi:hypothetical protein